MTLKAHWFLNIFLYMIDDLAFHIMQKKSLFSFTFIQALKD